MSDFDFDESFAGDLRKERHFEPGDEAWSKLETELAAIAARKKRRGAFFWTFPAAAGLVIAFLALNAFQAHRQLRVMRSEIAQLKQALGRKQNGVQTDTAYRHYAVIRYDTIYRTLVLQRPVFASESKMAQSDAGRDTAAAQSAKGLSAGAAGLLNAEKTAPLTPQENGGLPDAATVQTAGSGNTGIAPPADSMLYHSAPAALQALPTPALRRVQRQQQQHVPDSGLFMFANTVPNRHDKLIHRFRPHDAGIGLQGGIVFPQAQHAQSLNAYALGLSGLAPFGRQLQLRGSAEYVLTRFHILPSDQAVLDIPQLNAPTPNDQLSAIKVDQPLWVFSIGLGYNFSPDTRLQPFASVSWVAEKTMEQTLQYEFKNQLTKEDDFIRVPRNESAFNTGGLRLGLGADWAFAHRFSLQLEGMYQRQFYSSTPLLVERWGIKTGVLYHF